MKKNNKNKKEVYLYLILIIGSLIPTIPSIFLDYTIEEYEGLINIGSEGFKSLNKEFVAYYRPFARFVAALSYKFFNHNANAYAIINLILFCASSIILFKIGETLYSKRTGILTYLFFISFGPIIELSWNKAHFVYFLMLFLVLWSFYFLIKYNKNYKNKNIIYSTILLLLALLTNILAIVIIPIFVLYQILKIHNQNKKILKNRVINKYFLYAITIIILLCILILFSNLNFINKYNHDSTSQVNKIITVNKELVKEIIPHSLSLIGMMLFYTGIPFIIIIFQNYFKEKKKKILALIISTIIGAIFLYTKNNFFILTTIILFALILLSYKNKNDLFFLISALLFCIIPLSLDARNIVMPLIFISLFFGKKLDESLKNLNSKKSNSRKNNIIIISVIILLILGVIFKAKIIIEETTQIYELNKELGISVIELNNYLTNKRHTCFFQDKHYKSYDLTKNSIEVYGSYNKKEEIDCYIITNKDIFFSPESFIIEEKIITKKNIILILKKSREEAFDIIEFNNKKDLDYREIFIKIYAFYKPYYENNNLKFRKTYGNYTIGKQAYSEKKHIKFEKIDEAIEKDLKFNSKNKEKIVIKYHDEERRKCSIGFDNKITTIVAENKNKWILKEIKLNSNINKNEIIINLKKNCQLDIDWISVE